MAASFGYSYGWGAGKREGATSTGWTPCYSQRYCPCNIIGKNTWKKRKKKKGISLQRGSFTHVHRAGGGPLPVWFSIHEGMGTVYIYAFHVDIVLLLYKNTAARYGYNSSSCATVSNFYHTPGVRSRDCIAYLSVIG